MAADANRMTFGANVLYYCFLYTKKPSGGWARPVDRRVFETWRLLLGGHGKRAVGLLLQVDLDHAL